MKEHLHRGRARRHVREALAWIPDRAAIDDRVCPGWPRFHINAERLLGLWPVVDLEARLGAIVVRQHQYQPAIERFVGQGRWKRDGKPHPGLTGALTRAERRQRAERHKAGTSG